jgi:alginate O-acetyltransferase complex protein AlgI
MFGIGATGFIDSTALYYFKTGFILLLISILACRPTPYQYFRRLLRRRPAVALAVNLILFALSVAYMVYNSYTPFLYAKF